MQRSHIGRRVNLYWSVSEPVVVDFAPSAGMRRFPSVYTLIIDTFSLLLWA